MSTHLSIRIYSLALWEMVRVRALARERGRVSTVLGDTDERAMGLAL
jgi:hypothetical protein